MHETQRWVKNRWDLAMKEISVSASSIASGTDTLSVSREPKARVSLDLASIMLSRRSACGSKG